jgi:DNA polymerase epsilon subunit 1
MPNKHIEETDQFYQGHKVENQTYVGGHVEALEAGVFRSDIATDFKTDPTAAQQVIHFG